MMRSGIPAEDVLRICTLSISGWENGQSGQFVARHPDPEFNELLGLEGGIGEYPVSFGNFPTNPREITLMTRSMTQILREYAYCIDVPESDIHEGRIYAASTEVAEAGNEVRPLIEIHRGKSHPDDAFVAVEYRGRWYWIDDRDAYSKSTFSFLRILFASTERGAENQSLPVITIPTGR